MKKYNGWVIKSFFYVPASLIYHTFRTTRNECIWAYCESIGKKWYVKNRKAGNIETVKVRIIEEFDD